MTLFKIKNDIFIDDADNYIEALKSLRIQSISDFSQTLFLYHAAIREYQFKKILGKDEETEEEITEIKE